MFSFFGCNPKQNQKNKSKITNVTENLPFFGQISRSHGGYYEVENVKINDNIVSIDLNFEGDKINPKTLENVRMILNNIEIIDKKVKNIFRDYMDEKGMVSEYYKFHIEEIDNKTLEDFLKDTNQNLTKELQLLSKTKLTRIGLSPNSPKFLTVLDYRVSSELSADILVVFLNDKGGIERITIES